MIHLLFNSPLRVVSYVVLTTIALTQTTNTQTLNTVGFIVVIVLSNEARLRHIETQTWSGKLAELTAITATTLIYFPLGLTTILACVFIQGSLTNTLFKHLIKKQRRTKTHLTATEQAAKRYNVHTPNNTYNTNPTVNDQRPPIRQDLLKEAFQGSAGWNTTRNKPLRYTAKKTVPFEVVLPPETAN